MEIVEFLKLLNKKKQTVVAVVFFFLLLSVVLLAFQSFKYEAKSNILLLQYNGEAADSYNAAKSNQFISNLLAQVVPSNAFLNDVFESGFNVDKAYFGENQNDKLKIWKKTVAVRALDDTGVIEIDTYHTDKEQAEQINNAIINVIKTKKGTYYGRNDDISIRVIDEPLASTWPVQPNVLLSLSLVIFIALLISFSYIILFPGVEYDLSLWPKGKKKNKTVEVKNINYIKTAPSLEIGRDFPVQNKVNDFNRRGDIKNIFDQSDTK